MIYEETVDAYNESRQKALDLLSEGAKKFLESNDTIFLFYPRITEEVEFKIYNNLRIAREETILFIFNTLLMDEMNSGIIVTDCGIHVILDSEYENRKEYLSWKSIDRVICGPNSKGLDIFRVNEEKVSLALFHHIKTKRQISISSSVGLTTAAAIALSRGGLVGGLLGLGIVGAEALFLKLPKEYNKQICDYFAEIFTAMAETQKPENTDLVEHFFELPYEERKVIMLTKQHSEPHKKQACIFFNYECLPEIEFQLKRPVVNQLYVGHPFYPKKYYPIEEYKLELLKDKLDEFCEIMQSLGAEEIDIEDSRNSYDSEEASINNKVNGNVGYDNINVSAGQEKNKTNKIIESLGQRIKLHKKYNPSWNPVLPENLVWYQYEPSWKRKYKDRTGNSSLLEIEELIETSRSSEISNSEWKKITAAVKAEIVDVDAEWERSMEEKFNSQENATLSIKVKFAPLESLRVDEIAEGSKV